MRPGAARERCPFCGAKGAVVVYKRTERGDGRIAGEYVDEVKCPNPECSGKPNKSRGDAG